MNDQSINPGFDLLRFYLGDGYSLAVEVSPWLVAVVVTLIIVLATQWHQRRFKVVRLDISLGGIGKVELRPREENIEIAHKIWTELVTRKAALPVDPEHDVVVEVYNSWHALFARIRDLISKIPARLVRDDRATQELVRIATESLNKGLRPHLTRWQARFRNWYAGQSDSLETKTPQEVQREFPEYEELMADLLSVNKGLIQYAAELKKLVDGK